MAFGSQVLSIYTREKDVIESGMEILAITTVPYFLCGIMDLFPGALRGMGHSAVPMILSVIGTVGTRILWIFGFFPHHKSLYFLFISYPASWIITIVMQVICFYFVRKTVRRELMRGIKRSVKMCPKIGNDFWAFSFLKEEKEHATIMETEIKKIVSFRQKG